MILTWDQGYEKRVDRAAADWARDSFSNPSSARCTELRKAAEKASFRPMTYPEVKPPSNHRPCRQEFSK